MNNRDSANLVNTNILSTSEEVLTRRALRCGSLRAKDSTNGIQDPTTSPCRESAHLKRNPTMTRIGRCIRPIFLSFFLLSVAVCVPGPATGDGMSVEGLPGFEEHFIEVNGFEERFIKVNGTELHVVLGGEGAPLVLVHGWPHSWHQWQRVMPELAQSRTLIVPDLRGVGGSTPTEAGYDKHNLAEDLHQLIQSLGYTNVDVAGHDIGGIVGFAWALSYPHEIDSLTIMDVAIPGLDPVWSIVNGLAWHFRFHQASNNLAEKLIQGHQTEYFSHFYKVFSFDGSPFSDYEAAIFAEAYASDLQLRAGFEFYRAFPQDEQDVKDAVGTPLTMPILLLGGEVSLGPLIEQEVSSLQEFGATNVRSHIVQGAGHWIVGEQPKAVVKRLLEFID
jgi:pimeloyl-ACP methyl ester carboxylesterase